MLHSSSLLMVSREAASRKGWQNSGPRTIAAATASPSPGPACHPQVSLPTSLAAWLGAAQASARTRSAEGPSTVGSCGQGVHR